METVIVALGEDRCETEKGDTGQNELRKKRDAIDTCVTKIFRPRFTIWVLASVTSAALAPIPKIHGYGNYETTLEHDTIAIGAQSMTLWRMVLASVVRVLLAGSGTSKTSAGGVPKVQSALNTKIELHNRAYHRSIGAVADRDMTAKHSR